MALETVSEFFGVHLSPKTKQDMRVVSALEGYKTTSEYIRDLIEADMKEKLEKHGVAQPPARPAPQPMR